MKIRRGTRRWWGDAVAQIVCKRRAWENEADPQERERQDYRRQVRDDYRRMVGKP